MIDAAVTNAVAALQAAVASVTLQGASQQTLAPIVTAVTAALAAIDAQASEIEAMIDETSVGGIHVGTMAPALAATLLTQTQAIADLSTLQTLRGYVSRIGANIANAPG